MQVACWWAAWARGGTLPSCSGQGQDAQSPSAKIFSSRVVCHHLLPGHHVHAELLELLGGFLGQTLGQRRQDAGRRLDEADSKVPFGNHVVQAVGGQCPGDRVELRREFHAGRARADDGDVQLGFLDRSAVGVRLEIGRQQTLLEALGLLGSIEKHAVFANALNTEIVADAADGDYRGVEGNRALGNELSAVLVESGCNGDFAGRALETAHAPETKAESVGARLGQVLDLVFVDVHGASGDLVQQWLPHMRPRGVDQGDVGPPPLAKPVA